MQEQSPLRPAEFAKIRDGFIAFLKQPAETPLQAIIPADVLDAMASTARRGRKRRWWLDSIGRAHVCTPVTNAHLVCRLLLDKKTHPNSKLHTITSSPTSSPTLFTTQTSHLI